MKYLICLILGHNWTCKTQQGIDPTEEELAMKNGFWHYARMYCLRCDKQSNLNRFR